MGAIPSHSCSILGVKLVLAHPELGLNKANPSESNPGMQHSPVWHAEHSWGHHIATGPETGGSS